MCIPLSDDKHRKVRDSSKSALEIQDKFSLRKNSVQEFFPMVRIFFWTEFCLGLYLSWTEFCLGLHIAVVFRMQSFNSYKFGVSSIWYNLK